MVDSEKEMEEIEKEEEEEVHMLPVQTWSESFRFDVTFNAFRQFGIKI